MNILTSYVRKMYILLLLDGVFYKYHLDQIDSWCYLSQVYLYRFLHLLDFLIISRGLVIYNSISGLFVSPFSFVIFCLIYFDSLWLGAYMLRIVLYLENCAFYHYCFEVMSNVLICFNF